MISEYVYRYDCYENAEVVITKKKNLWKNGKSQQINDRNVVLPRNLSKMYVIFKTRLTPTVIDCKSYVIDVRWFCIVRSMSKCKITIIKILQSAFIQVVLQCSIIVHVILINIINIIIFYSLNRRIQSKYILHC